MYIKSQINKKQDSEDKIIQEINKILDKKTITKSDRLRFNELMKSINKDINEVY